MTARLASTNPEIRCRYRSSSGRRCRAAIQNHRLDFCPKHAESTPTPQPPTDFLQRLTTGCDEFTTAMGIHNSLSELYKLLAADLISARRAAVLAYIANLLLRTIPVVHGEIDRKSENEPLRLDVTFGDPQPLHGLSAMEPVPEQGENEAKEKADRAGYKDQQKGCAPAKSRNGEGRIQKMKPEDKVDKPLRDARCDANDPEEMPEAEERGNSHAGSARFNRFHDEPPLTNEAPWRGKVQ